MSRPDRPCAAGCGRPAERGDPYCLSCQLDGTAPELPPLDDRQDLAHRETIVRLSLALPRRSRRQPCPECGAERDAACTYRKARRGLVVELRCPNRGEHMTERSRRNAQRV